MSEPIVFYPQRRAGLALHFFLCFILAAGSGMLFWLAFGRTGGVLMILYLFGALAVLGLLIFIVYRTYALLHASYTIERDGIRIRWGLRREDIPFSEMEWIHAADELITPLRMPVFSMPGAYLGSSDHPELGKIEFIASDVSSMVVIESFDQVLVLSPEKREEFITAFSRALEMGSLSPIEELSSHPAAFILDVPSHKLARTSIIVSVLLTLGLLVITSLVIPSHSLVSMGINSAGEPQTPVSSSLLLLIPTLASLTLIANIIFGLYFFRNEEYRPVSYTIWVIGMATPFLLIIAVLLIAF